MTVYRRPDPIPLHRSRPAADFALHAVRPEQEDLHRLVSRQIFAAIWAGRYPEGSILPNEQALSEELGVSRTALREAVKGLAAKGLLETRRRRGTIVLARGRWNFLDAEIIEWLRRDEPDAVSDELWHAVAAVLPGLAAAAATRGVPLQVAAGDAEDVLAGRLSVLLELARLAGNRFLLSLVSISLLDLCAADPALFARRTEWLDARAARALAELVAGRRADEAALWVKERLRGPAELPVA